MVNSIYIIKYIFKLVNIMKILIIGSVGSGKTTLAKRLSKQCSRNYYEIDSIVHDDTKDGIKRSIEEQNLIINEINENKDWIIEGVLRKNLYYLLDISEKIIFIDIPIFIINIRILKRFIKQLLKIEKCNYKTNYKMLKLMYKWSNNFSKKKKNLYYHLDDYKEKLMVIKNNKDFKRILKLRL